MGFNTNTIRWLKTGDTMKRVGAGWVDDTDGLWRYGSRSARKSHIIFCHDFGLGRVGALGRRGGSRLVIVRALEIWVGADLGQVQPH